MQDRVPAPGKANRVRIRLDDGQTIEGVFEYADEATVEGSAYNKSNVLPDDVCASLGIPTTAEPKEAFLQTSSALKSYKLLKKITTSTNWTCPDGVFDIIVMLVGGGGGGQSAVNTTDGSGGQGGRAIIVHNVSVIPGNSYKITIGSGGNANSNGGTTTAFGYSAVGGNSGNSAPNEKAGSSGGKPGSPGNYGGTPSIYSGDGDNINDAKLGIFNTFVDLFANDWYGAGGGGNEANGGPHAGNGGDPDVNPNGTAAEAGYGAGGGGGSGKDAYNPTAGVGGKGGKGAVLIYARGE